jgi:hypothetical protein
MTDSHHQNRKHSFPYIAAPSALFICSRLPFSLNLLSGGVALSLLVFENSKIKRNISQPFSAKN